MFRRQTNGRRSGRRVVGLDETELCEAMSSPVTATETHRRVVRPELQLSIKVPKEVTPCFDLFSTLEIYPCFVMHVSQRLGKSTSTFTSTPP